MPASCRDAEPLVDLHWASLGPVKPICKHTSKRSGTVEQETEQQVSAAATDVALPSFTVPHAGGVIDVRPAHRLPGSRRGQNR